MTHEEALDLFLAWLEKERDEWHDFTSFPVLSAEEREQAVQIRGELDRVLAELERLMGKVGS